jgi:hypothetical protein
MPTDQWMVLEEAQHPPSQPRSGGNAARRSSDRARSSPEPMVRAPCTLGWCPAATAATRCTGITNCQGGYYTCSQYWNSARSGCVPNTVRRTAAEEHVLGDLAGLARSQEILEQLEVVETNGALG